MSAFEKEIQDKIRLKILNEIGKHDYTKIDYYDKKQIPKEVIEKIWQSVNWDEVIEEIRPHIQKRISNSIIGAMETELKTDIKKLLAVEGVREKIKLRVYPEIMKILDEESK